MLKLDEATTTQPRGPGRIQQFLKSDREGDDSLTGMGRPGGYNGNQLKVRPRGGEGALVQMGRFLTENPYGRAALMRAVGQAGAVAGVARGAWHTAEDIGHLPEQVGRGAMFIGKLAVPEPIDRLISRPGQSSREQLARGGRQALKAGRGAIAYAERGIRDPNIVKRDAARKFAEARRHLDPSASPSAKTLPEELRRQFNIGMNQGELGFDVATTVVGAAPAKAVLKASRIARTGRVASMRTANIQRYVEKNFAPERAAYLAGAYSRKNMGHHYIPRRWKWVPKWFLESDYNVLKPHEISRGEMYELHGRVDPKFHYARMARGMKGWNAKDIQLRRHGLIGRIVEGAPLPLKTKVAGIGGSLGGWDGWSDPSGGERR